MVSKISIAYHAPAKLDDLISVHTKIESCSRISITFKQDIFLDQKLLASLQVVVVGVHQETGRPVAFSKEIQTVLMEIMND